MERGYIKIYRKLLDSGIIQNPTALQLFCYLLLTAAYKPVSRDVRGEMIKLEPGQCIFGRKIVAEKLKIGEQSIRTALKYLEKNEILTIRATKRYSLITIINWNTYQDKNDSGNHQTNHELTMSQPSANHELTTVKEFKKLRKEESKILKIEEGKNGEEGKNQKTKEASLLVGESVNVQGLEKKGVTGNTLPEMKKAIEAYTANEELRAALFAWLEMRCATSQKRPTGYALDNALKKLDRIGENVTDKIAIVNESVVNNWMGFFELKKDRKEYYRQTRDNSAFQDHIVFEENQKVAQRWLERELKKQEEQNGEGTE